VLELGNLPRDGLHGKAKIVGDIKPSERNLDFDGSGYTGTCVSRRIEEKGGDTFVSARASEADHLVLRRPHFGADLSVELRTQPHPLVDMAIETVTRKPLESYRRYGVSREQIGVAGGQTEKIASVAKAQDGAPPVFHRPVDPHTTIKQMKDVRGDLPFPAKCPRRRVSLRHLNRKDISETILRRVDCNILEEDVRRLSCPGRAGELTSCIGHGMLR
jgi:hypothetical protein